MASLTNQKISNSYLGLLNTTSNGVLTASLAQITDGNGNGSPIYLSTAALNLYNKYTFPDAVPANGTFLKATNGSGTLEWVAESGGDVTKTGTIALNTIAVWNDNADQLRSDTTMSINASHNISLLQTNSNGDDLNSYNIGGGNIANVTGSRNVGFGKQNLNAVLAGSDNTAMGDGSLEKVTSGNSNTGFGSDALGNSTSGDFNTAVGSGALNDVLTGEDNTAVGYNAGGTVSTGSDNTYIGKSAGLLDTGSNNIYIGEGSGSSVASGNNNVILGSNTGNTISATSNNIIISDGSGNNRIQVNSSGNVGIGVAPSAWRDSVAVNSVIQGADNYAILNRNDSGTKTNYFAQNFYYNTSDVGARIDASKWSLFYSQNQEDGSHGFYTSSDNSSATPSMQSKLTISSGGAATFSTTGNNGIINIGGSTYYSQLETDAVLGGLKIKSVWGGANSGIIQFINGTSENVRMHIADNGNVLVGLANPATNVGKFEVETASAIAYTPTANITGTNLRLATGGTAATNVTTGVSMGIGGNAEAYIGAVQNSSGYADIVFQSYNGSYSEKMRLSSSGYLIQNASSDTSTYFQIQNQGTTLGYLGNDSSLANAPTTATQLVLRSENDMAFTTGGGTRRLTISSGGLATFQNGIQFGTGTTLDKYEEGGTWTVSIISGGTIGTTANSRYTIIGNICYFSFYCYSISITSNSSELRISLPVAGDTTAADYTSANIAYSGSFNTSTYLPIINDGTGSGTYIYFHKNNGSSSTIANSDATSLTELIISGWYYV